MKRVFGLFGLLALLLLAVVPHTTAQEGGLLVNVVQEARFRAGPGTEWRILSTVAAGTPIALDARDGTANTWVRGIVPDGTVGWLISTATNATPDQLNGLPIKAQDDPFTLAAPAGGAAPSAPASTAPDATPAPADAGQAAAPPPPVAAGPAPVRGFNLGGHVQGFSAQTVNAMRRSGMTWVKKQFRYLDGQNPADAAGLINDAHANGFKILVGVVGYPNELGREGYNERYAAFVGGLAALGADAIEVWNEPNIDREWPTGQISPQAYVNLLAPAYNAIKAANRNTLVITGAPAPTGFFGGCSGAGCDDNLFIRGLASAGAANYADCVGIHYNEGILPPTARTGDPRGSGEHYTRYFGRMMDTYWSAFGGRRPLCFTEMGYLSPEGFGPLPGAFGWAENVTVAQQAAWLDQAANIAARSGRVRLFIIWNVDFTNYGDDPMAGYAMIRPDGSCPACDALGN